MSSSCTLCPEEEISLTRQARQTEQAARLLLEGLPAARAALRHEAKHNTEMERLRAALGDCEEAGHRLPRVQSLLRAADQHHWRLALSATYCLRLEARRFTAARIGREDLVQQGYIGLLEAARRFDPERKLRFGTYARWWVRAHMQRVLESSGRLVRMPTTAVEDLRHLSDARRERLARGEPSGVAGLAEAAGVSGERARFLLQQGQCISLDETNDEGIPVQECLADAPAGDCEAQLIQHQTLARLDAALRGVLDERERMILTRHFGLDGEPHSSLVQISGALGLSRERIRQLEVLSLQHLRFIL